MKKLLFEDINSITVETGKLGRVSGELNAIQEFFNEHDLGIINPNMVRKFVQDPEGTVRDIFKSRIPDNNEYTGLPNNKEAILVQMQLPRVGQMEMGYIRLYLNELGLFDFGEEISLNSDRLNKHMDVYRYYSDDPEVLQAFDKLNEVAILLTEVNEKYRFIPLGDHNMTNHNYNLGHIIAFTPRGFKVQREGFRKAIQKL